MIGAVACDLDGTLVRDFGTVAAQDLAALAEAARRGCRSVLVTGRPSRCLADVRDVVAVFDRVYASNGAERLDFAGRRQVRSALSRCQVRDVVTLVNAWDPTASYAVEYGTHFGYEEDYSYWPATDKEQSAVVGAVGDLVAGSAPLIKLLVKTPRIASHDLLDRLGSSRVDVSVTHSNPHGRFGPVEVTAAAATKGRAVAEFAAEVGVELGDFAAFGDRLNDLSMLRIVGHPVVVRGAGEPELARFEQIGGDGDEGVGAWLLGRLRNAGHQPAEHRHG